MEDEKYRIPLFDGSNFDHWKFRIETHLDELDLLDFVHVDFRKRFSILESDTEAQKTHKERELNRHRKVDKKCKSQLIQKISDHHLDCVKDKETAFDIWQTLNDHYARKGIANQLLLRKTLLTMKLDPSSGTLENHFLKFDKLIRELKSAGANMEEMDIVCHLLLTMPSEYQTVVTALETLSSDKLSLSFVKTRLLDEQSKKNAECISNGNSVTFSSVSDKKINKLENQNAVHQIKCNYCHKIGHKRSQCFKLKKKQQMLNVYSRKTNVAEIDYDKDEFGLTVSTADNSLNSTDFIWLLDSGATDHMISDQYLNHVSNIRPLINSVTIKVAKSGTVLQADKVCDVHASTNYKGKLNHLKILNVLIVPGLQFNLLSVGKMDSGGYKIVFNKGEAMILKNNIVVAAAIRSRKVYKLIFSKSSICANAISNHQWHQRLGHISNDNLKKLSTLVNGIKLNESSFPKICETCIQAKQTRLPHNKTRVRAKQPLHLIHSDLLGPIKPESYDGKRYVLTFIDDFTHFTIAYTLKSKTEVFAYFKIYEAMVTSHFNLKVSRFRCDNGKEYVSYEMLDYFKNKGIQIEYTIRYTPSQNGVAERMNRTLMEKVRCMILSSSQNKDLWSEAVMASIYLINRSPTEALQNKVPAEMWYNQKQNLQKLKIFGCAAYLRLPNQLIGSKLDSRTLKCIMVGYCSNGYRLWNSQQKKIIKGHDVIFDENTFPGSHVTNNAVSQDCRTESEDIEEIKISSENLYCTHSDNKEDFIALALSAEAYIDNVPQSFADILQREDKELWMEAVNEEMAAINKNQTWTLSELPPGKKAISCKWLFKIKYKQDGSVDRYKARLVARGCTQKKGIDYNEVYAPVAHLTTVRMLLAIINKENLFASQMDVKNAFLHGYLNEEIYMQQPSGFVDDKKLVCKLNKSLYGLKQAPRAWNARFDEAIKSLGFKVAKNEICLYYMFQDEIKIFILIYVDDVILAGNNLQQLNNIKKGLMHQFEMKDLGDLNSYLGIKIERNKNGMNLSQEIYLKKVLHRFGMSECKPARTPMEIKIPEISEETECIINTKPYRELVGSLMYAMLTTRPDLSYSINYFSRFQHNATEMHWIGLKRILRYIKATLDHGLFYPKNSNDILQVYVDADWANDNTTRKSTSGFLLQLFGASISWTTRKQSTVALSSTEAEYTALATAATEIVWIRSLFNEIGMNLGPTIVHEDNQSTIRCLDKWEHRRLKHVDIKYHFVRDLVLNNEINVKYVSTNEQYADILTKSLTYDKFKKFCNCIGLCRIEREY